MRLQSATDQELVKMYVKGQENALGELLRRHKQKIYTSILVFVKNDVKAEDIFQDTFVKIIESLRRGKYYEDGKFLPWAMRIAHNLCIDNYRKSKRAPMVTTSEGYDIFNIMEFSSEDNGEDMMVKGEAKEKVRKLIDELPPEQREVVILRHYADMSFKEIAQMTDVSINTALGRMRYALINMRKMIETKKVVF